MWNSEKLRCKCKVVTAIGMFYDMDNPNEFIKGIADVLTDDGVFIAQLMTLAPMLSKTDLGNVCHEHIEYYSYKSLVKLYEQNGLQITKVVKNDIQGGSYQLWASKLDEGSIDHYEDTKEQLETFVKRIDQNGNLLCTILKDRCNLNKKCYVHGASNKGNNMLHIWKLKDYFVGAAEIHPDKIGRYTVGTDIPIVSEEQALEDADVFFVPNFGFKDMFIEKLKPWIEQGGELIFAMPTVEVVCENTLDKHI